MIPHFSHSFIPEVLLTPKIDVYECVVGQSPVMRRCKDDWVNATQILKLCNFPKAKRTKILEKGVQVGQHEKVQGGYGRFQGTWIPLEDARNLANEYGIGADLVPVLYIDVEDPNLIIPKKTKPGASTTAPKSGTTPVKRKYLKKTKDTPKKQRVDDLPPPGVYVQDYMAMNNNVGPLQQDDGNVSMHMPHISVPQIQNSGMHDYSQMSSMNGHMSADNSFNRSYDSYQIQAGPGFVQPPQHPPNQQHLQTQYHEMQNNTSNIEDMSQQHILYQANLKSALSHGTNETNWSQEDQNRDSDTSVSSAEVKNNMSYETEPSHAAQMLRYFSEDNLPIPQFIYNPTADFDINDAIDDEGHTTLHWAASIGNLNLVLLVLSKGANPLVVSNFGMNPLSKCITFNNCFDLGNFQNVLNALEACLIHTDINGRTPLHYVCQFSKVRSKLPSLLHYTELMFRKILAIAGHGSATRVNLFRNVLNHQDINGDTCLHLAARSACPELFRFFLRHGAQDDLVNSMNELPKFLMLQIVPSIYDFNTAEVPSVFEQSSTPSQPELEQQRRGSQSSQKLSAPQSVHKKRHLAHDIGTPTQPRFSHTVTPDTQKTTIQEDDEEDDINDRVTKDQLRSLMEESSVNIEDNKENIFLQDHKKLNYGAMSTPKPSKQAQDKAFTLPTDKAVVETQSPLKDYVPNPPMMDKSGKIVRESHNAKTLQDQNLPLPIHDVASMLHGMINSFTSSCDLELKNLTEEQTRLQETLNETKSKETKQSQKLNVLMRKNGFSEVDNYSDASVEVQRHLANHETQLATKERQLLDQIEKFQFNELTNLIASHLSRTSGQDESDNDQHKFDLVVQITRAQLKRGRLVQTLLQSMKQYAIDSSMNKYRKLISLSCGLRVEDIDSLIDGIEESLTDGSA